ncbi:MAG: copper homeostasis protein CutC [Proteobacteria bacterium]|nr:copper homeostasis protein CutC [Pseudomonadota bacterium]
MRPESPLLEVCCATREALEMAARARVARIELCENLAVDGLTPSTGFLREAIASGLKTHALVRPRAGDFVYSEAEILEICECIRGVLDAGAHGVVVGAARSDGSLDRSALKRFKQAARDATIYCHRVFDTVPDKPAAIRDLVSFGFDGVLTSGGPGTALEHLESLRTLIGVAPSGFTVMVGGKVRSSNLSALRAATGARAFHSSVGDPSRSLEFQKELQAMQEALASQSI